MEDKTYEVRQQWSLLYVFVVLFVSSLPLPFWFHSFGLKFTNVVDANDRHYIFLLCNVILAILFFYSGTKDSCQTQSQLDHTSSIVDAHDLPKQVAIDERPKAKQIECDEISVSSGLEEKTDQVEVDDSEDEDEHIETKHVVCAEYFHHEIISKTKVEVEEEEEGHIGTLSVEVDDHEDQTDNMEIESFVHDQEEDVNELNQKFDAFIHRMKQKMRREVNFIPCT